MTPDDFEVWFEGKDRKSRATIAFRTAARVWPYTVGVKSKNQGYMFPVIWALFKVNVVGCGLNAAEAKLWGTAPGAAAAQIGDVSGFHRYQDTAQAACRAAAWASYTVDTTAKTSFKRVFDETETALSSMASGNPYTELKEDCGNLDVLGVDELWTQPLWRKNPNDLTGEWLYRAVQNWATVAPVFHRCGRRKSRPLFV